MTAEDKDIVQTWRRKRRADKLSEPKPKKKTGLGSLPVVTSTQKINVTTHNQTPNSHSTISSSVDSSVTDVQLTTIATKNPTVPSLSATSPTLPAIVVQDGDLSTAVPIVPSLSISDSSTASNSYTISTTQTSHSSTSNIFPSILSVSNHNFPSILPTVTTSITSVPRTLTASNNHYTFSAFPLVTSSSHSTVQSFVPSTMNSDPQPLAPLTLDVTSEHSLPYSTFLSELHGTSKNMEPIDVSSFNNLSFEFEGTSEPRVSTPVQSGFLASSSLQETFPRSRGPNNFHNNTLPGQAENPLIVDQINTKIDNLSQRVDMVLANQRFIMDCLQHNANSFLNRPPTSRTPVSVAAEQNRNPHFNPPAADDTTSKELTMEELEALKNFKKKQGTTDAHFAVILLKEYTTPEERMNCTVNGAGPKSKELRTDVLMKIKKGYERFYSNDSWGDAIKAMNTHMRKYCSSRKDTHE